MTDQIPMRSASERRDAAKPVLMWLGVCADRAREVVTEIEESREADGIEAVIDARDAADDHLSHYVQHIEQQRAVLEALLEVPEVGVTEDELVAEVIAEFERETGMYYPPAVLVGVRNWVARGIRAGERAALEHWESADVPSQEFMLRHLGITHTTIPGNARIRIPAQSIKKEVM